MAGRGGIYGDLHGDGREVNRVSPVEPKCDNPRVYLRCVDPGTDNECWVICAKGDSGATAFVREET
jgi:hypothetical protein